MSLRPQQPIPPVPDDTTRVARAAFPRCNPYVLLRDRLGAVFDERVFKVAKRGTKAAGSIKDYGI
jgi:hypothetical protein